MALNLGPFTEAQLLSWKKGTSVLSLLAGVEYKDQFGDRHRSRSCITFSVESGKWENCIGEGLSFAN